MHLVMREFVVMLWIGGIAAFFAWLFQAWAWLGWLLALVLSTRWLLALSASERWLSSGGRRLDALSAGILADFLFATGALLMRERRQARQLLGRARYFKHAAESLPEGVIAVDGEHRIAWFNQGAMQLLGLHRRNRGQMVFAVLRLPQVVQLLKDATSDTLEMPSPIAQDRILSLQVSPFLEGHRLLIIRDITLSKRNDRIRRDFVANASHELRTPLTVMQGYLETMVDAQDPNLTHWQKPMEQMLNQTERMRKIVEDMLLLSTLEGTEHKLQVADVDVPRLLVSLVDEMRQLSGTRGHDIQLRIETTAHLLAHEDYLYSAFANLVSNAVRYTPDGGKIEVRWWQSTQGLCFSVTDTGIGIEPQHLPRLSERFYRADNARSRATGGTGLGLSITRHVLERHNASLTIDSVLGKGSCFTCCFPLPKH